MFLLRKPLFIAALIVLLFFVLLGWYWSSEPSYLRLESLKSQPEQRVVGVVTTEVLIKSVETLLNKPGGYITNDVTPSRCCD